MKLSKTKKQAARIACLIAAAAVLSGCGNMEENNNTVTLTPTVTVTPTGKPAVTDKPEPTNVPTPQPTSTPAPTATPTPSLPLVVSGKEDIKKELYAAITELRQPFVMDISDAGLSEHPHIDVLNLYYAISAEFPELKYAYNITAEVNGSELSCEIFYMPYMTGKFPENFEGIEIDSLNTLIAVAEEHLGTEPVNIRITNTTLEPDTLWHALQQAGGVYVVCKPSQDATQILFEPPMGVTMEEALAALEEIEQYADKIVSEVLEDGMTEYEKAEALYSYVTETVTYDWRYYNDLKSMPYQSRTALGAFKDGVAICGGYSNAVKILFEKAGIRCYNVSGTWTGEGHMWNIALIDGQWRWCDATADRGRTRETGFQHFLLEELSKNAYSWREESIVPLLAE